MTERTRHLERLVQSRLRKVERDVREGEGQTQMIDVQVGVAENRQRDQGHRHLEVHAGDTVELVGS